MTGLVLHLFGSPRMELHGAPVEVDTRKATALLAYLAVNGEPYQRDSLAALLWPDYDQTSARAALRRTLSTLNLALESKQGEKYLDISRESIGLAAGADIWQDVGEYRRLMATLNTHGHASNEICPSCLRALEAAAALYPEPFMAGFNLRDSSIFEEWQFFQEETLRRSLSGTLEKLAFGLAAAGRVEEAIQHARRWLALDTLSEEAHRQLMLLYLQSGQRNAALRQYRECVRILDQELGVAPLEETTQLYNAIFNHKSLPEAQSRLRYVQTTPGQALAVEAAAQKMPAAGKMPAAKSQVEMVDDRAPAAPPEAERQPAIPLIGRQEDLARLDRLYWSTRENAREDGCFITLEGEAGIGKTRLAETFLSSARAKGARVVQARCYAGEAGLAYAPFLEAFNMAINQPDAAARLKPLPPGTLAEIGRLLPDITSLVQAPAADQQAVYDAAQARFYEALRQGLQALLAGPAPGILFLDNLHWADSASIDLLTYLARRLKNTGLWVLAAWRNEPGETAQCLERLAAEIARGGQGQRDKQGQRFQLRRLKQAEVIELVRAYPGVPSGETAEGLGQRLYQESEGLPFVAVEYLAMQAQRAATEGNAKGLTWEMPGSVRALLHSRLENLDAAALQLLSTAAVIGRSFDDQTLREVSGRSEIETVDGLDRLLAAGLVTEQTSPQQSTGEIRYDFTHEKLRAMIYEETSLARRRLLHRRIAETLSRLPGGRLENPGKVAHHFQQAGLDAQAAEYHLLAGERARRLFANTEAMVHFQSALAAGYPDAARLHEAIGDLNVLRGDYSAALTGYQAAAALCTPGCLANLEHKLGNVYQRMGEWELAESHFQAGLEALDGAPESPLHVQLFADRGLVAHARSDVETAQSLAGQALKLAQAAADPHALAQAYNLLGVLARSSGKPEAAINALEDSLRVAETLADPLARIAALNNLALVHGENDNLDEAIRLAGQALELCQKRGDRHREAALHNNLADLFHRAGREEEAMQQLKQAVVIFAEIGAPAEGAQPEIWKLTEW